MNRVNPANSRVWHPWLRVSRLIVGLRSTVWDAATWPLPKATLLDAMKERKQGAACWLV